MATQHCTNERDSQLPAQDLCIEWWMFSWKQSSRAVTAYARVRPGGSKASAPRSLHCSRTYVTSTAPASHLTATKLHETERGGHENSSPQRWLTARTSALYFTDPGKDTESLPTLSTAQWWYRCVVSRYGLTRVSVRLGSGATILAALYT